MTVQTAEKTTQRKPAASSAERRDFTYRQLRIVAGSAGGRCRAIAYRGGRRFLESDGSDVEAAIERLKQLIDDLQSERARHRRAGIPTPEEYADALARLDRVVTPVQQAALMRHSAAPAGRATMARLASQIGVDETAVTAAYARLGRLISEITGFEPDVPGLGKKLQAIAVLAEPVDVDAAQIEWVLRASLVVGIEEPGSPQWYSRQ